MRLATWVVVLAVGLSGCAGLMQPSGSWSSDQIAAWAKDKSGSVVCGQVIGAWGTTRIVAINLDQRVVDNGGISADADCRVSIQNAKTAPVPAAKASTSSPAGSAPHTPGVSP